MAEFDLDYYLSKNLIWGVIFIGLVLMAIFPILFIIPLAFAIGGIAFKWAEQKEVTFRNIVREIAIVLVSLFGIVFIQAEMGVIIWLAAGIALGQVLDLDKIIEEIRMRI